MGAGRPALRHRTALRPRALGDAGSGGAGRSPTRTSTCWRPRSGGCSSPGAPTTARADDLRRDPAVVPVFDFIADGVLRSIAASLERLGLDRIDLLHVHDPDDHLDQAETETFPTLLRLRDEGVIGAVGLGTNLARWPTGSSAAWTSTASAAGRPLHAARPAAGRGRVRRLHGARRAGARGRGLQQRGARRPRSGRDASTTRPRRPTCSPGCGQLAAACAVLRRAAGRGCPAASVAPSRSRLGARRRCSRQPRSTRTPTCSTSPYRIELWAALDA